MFYYAVDTTHCEDKEKENKYIRKRLNELVNDALILAKKAGFDVMNSLNLMDNAYYVDEQKFGKGDGFLNYYLYNWKCPDVTQSKVGLVML
jgi:glycylpeptide N-tetradecanoyltransferase